METLKFSKTHEWSQKNGDGLITIGISEHAQELLGDVVFIELKSVGTELQSNESFGVIESVKAASDVYAPIRGTIAAINEDVIKSPELVNQEPYKNGWLIKLKPQNENDYESLLNKEEYLKQIKDE